MEEKIKLETEKFINQLKEKYSQHGMVIDPINELFVRQGIAQGLLIAGIALCNAQLELFINIEGGTKNNAR